MAKHAKIEDEIKRLRTLSPDTLSPYTLRLPPTLALEAAHFARDNNYQMSRGLLAIVESYVRASQSGVAIEFSGDTQRQLDLIATAFGVSRSEVVARIVSENLVRYLQQAVVIEGERRQVERTLQTIRDTAEAAEPAKPPKPKK